MIKLKNPIIVAIDGFSSCGKSSFAKAIAKELDYMFVDSGAMYRAVTLLAMRKRIISKNKIRNDKLEKLLGSIEIEFRYNAELKKYETHLNGENVEEEIRSMKISENVSEISKIKAVRKRLVTIQQKFGEKKGVVMDGRDIGTVVYPYAEIKIFMTASIEVRAQRRYRELKEKGITATMEEVKKNLAQRDFMDQNRTESPLIQAEDAIILDNSDMTQDEQMEWFKKLLQEKSFLN